MSEELSRRTKGIIAAGLLGVWLFGGFCLLVLNYRAFAAYAAGSVLAIVTMLARLGVAADDRQCSEAFEKFQEGGLRNVGDMVAGHVRREGPGEPSQEALNAALAVGPSGWMLTEEADWIRERQRLRLRAAYAVDFGTGPAPQEKAEVLKSASAKMHIVLGDLTDLDHGLLRGEAFSVVQRSIQSLCDAADEIEALILRAAVAPETGGRE